VCHALLESPTFFALLLHIDEELAEASQIARALEISSQSVNRYIDPLCDLLRVRRLQPFRANIRKRLVKSPKVCVRDSGLVHALLGLETLTKLSGHPIVGASWEGFFMETLLAATPLRTQAYFIPHGRRRRDRPGTGVEGWQPLGDRDQARPVGQTRARFLSGRR